MKIIVLIILIIFVGYFIVFNNSKIISYENEYSEKFYKSFNNKNIENYINDKLLLVIRFKESDINKYDIWLGMYSRSQFNDFFITDIILNEKVIKYDKKIRLNKFLEENKIFFNSCKLFSITSSELNEFTKDKNSFFIKINYTINNSQKNKEFEIKRIVKRYIIYPT